MSKSLILPALFAVLLASGGAYAQDASSNPSSPDQIQPASVSDPAEFVAKAAASGGFEIQSSQLALTKTPNADTKTFAQMMIDDHAKAAQALQAPAAGQGVAMPAAPDADA